MLIKKLKYYLKLEDRVTDSFRFTANFSRVVERDFYHDDVEESVSWNCQCFLNAEYGHSAFLRAEKRYINGMLICSGLMIALSVLTIFDFKLMAYVVATKYTAAILLAITWIYCMLKNRDAWVHRNILFLLCNYHLLRINALLETEKFEKTLNPYAQIPEVFELLSKHPLNRKPSGEQLDMLMAHYRKEVGLQ